MQITSQTKQTLPVHGQTIVFVIAPPGSYVRTGEAYRVDRPKAKGDFRFVSVDRGSATYDRPHMVRVSAWHTA